jgi:hypothetical protein
MTKLPKWGDDDAALAAWVGERMPERHAEVLFPELITVQSGVPWQSWDAQAMEREAFDAAQQGDFRMLGWMLDQRMPLTRESMALIAARLMRKSKSKKRVGAAKQAIARRRAANPVHNAADEVPAIQAILQQLYPKQRGIRDRAIDLAAARAKIDRDRLAYHLNSKDLIPH